MLEELLALRRTPFYLANKHYLLYPAGPKQKLRKQITKNESCDWISVGMSDVRCFCFWLAYTRDTCQAATYTHTHTHTLTHTHTHIIYRRIGCIFGRGWIFLFGGGGEGGDILHIRRASCTALLPTYTRKPVEMPTINPLQIVDSYLVCFVCGDFLCAVAVLRILGSLVKHVSS